MISLLRWSVPAGVLLLNVLFPDLICIPPFQRNRRNVHIFGRNKFHLDGRDNRDQRRHLERNLHRLEGRPAQGWCRQAGEAGLRQGLTCFPSCLNSQNLNVEHQYDMTDIHILSRLWDKLIVSRWWAQPGTMLIAQTQCLPMHVRGHLPDWNQNTCTNTQKYNTCICLMIVPQRVYIFNVNQVAKLMKAMGDKKVDVAVLGYFVWLDHRSDVCDHVSWS